MAQGHKSKGKKAPTQASVASKASRRSDNKASKPSGKSSTKSGNGKKNGAADETSSAKPSIQAPSSVAEAFPALAPPGEALAKGSEGASNGTPVAVVAGGFVRLTRAGTLQPQPVYVNPTNVVLVEATAPAPGLLPQSPQGTTVHLMGQPTWPLYVEESVEAVLAALAKV